MSRKLQNWLLVIFFFLAIAIPMFTPLPALGFFWHADCALPGSFSPLCWLKTWIGFPAAFNRYFADHYLLHQQQVEALASTRLYLLNEKIFPNVLIGKEDWLYYTGENNIQDHECTMPFTTAELETIRARLLDWQAQLEQRGIRFYIVIAPNKESIYPQYLPHEVRAGVRACRINQVMHVLGSTFLNVLDMRGTLRNAAQTQQVYHRTDTHWNAAGALVASQEILARVRQDFPGLSVPDLYDYAQEVKAHSGDLASFLPPDERFIEQEIFLTPLAPDGITFEARTDGTELSTLPDSAAPAALVFCDSFADALKPYLSAHFSRVVYSRSFALDLALVEREQPQVVIFEIAQRYLTMLR